MIKIPFEYEGKKHHAEIEDMSFAEYLDWLNNSQEPYSSKIVKVDGNENWQDEPVQYGAAALKAVRTFLLGLLR